MIGIAGIALVVVMVFGGYTLAGGKLGIVLEAMPHELMTIFGAALGAFVIGNDKHGIKHTLKDISKVFKGPHWKPADYRDLLCLLFELIRLARQNPVAVEEHIERDDLVGAAGMVAESAGVDAEVAEFLTTYLAAGRAMLGVMPTQSELVVERFFDESGGMQLVIHSPYGGRINRAMGYALRKKFCRTFNFELQASASDDAVVISLGPHHSFPLDEVVRYLTPETIPSTLTQAVLDQPVFLNRWRWNLNRALVILRFRNGKKHPPVFQRMEADDLMAAVFPGAAACQENVVGPIEIPDHVLVRQTVRDALTENLDVDGLVALWSRITSGEVRVHARDTTEPSVLGHEILTARPYAFLDGGEAVGMLLQRPVPALSEIHCAFSSPLAGAGLQ